MCLSLASDQKSAFEDPLQTLAIFVIVAIAADAVVVAAAFVPAIHQLAQMLGSFFPSILLVVGESLHFASGLILAAVCRDRSDSSARWVALVWSS